MRRWARIRIKRAELLRIAKSLFRAVGKNPYYHRGQPIRNFGELKDNLDKLTGEEAPWVASWIEYIGDAKTAAMIRQTPDKFKEIITARYEQLKPYAV